MRLKVGDKKLRSGRHQHQRFGCDRESERAMGGVRWASVGCWPAGPDAPVFKWPLRSPPPPPHGKSGRAPAACMCAIARGTKEQTPPPPSASVPWGLFLSAWYFLCVFLRRPRSRPCGYFHAKTKGNRSAAKSGRSKAALSLEIGLLSLSMFDNNEMGPCPLSLEISLLSLSATIGPL